MVIAENMLNLECKLTDSDLELVKLLCLPNKIISQHLKMDRFAIGMQVKRIGNKLKVENRTTIVVRALELGLISIDQLVHRSYGETNLS